MATDEPGNQTADTRELSDPDREDARSGLDEVSPCVAEATDPSVP